MPQRIVYRNANDATSFDYERFKQSLQRYDNTITDENIKPIMKEFEAYDPLHVSCLVEIGTRAIPSDTQAERYCQDHSEWFGTANFERLRRITGYLVGSLERWNDGKQAEERDRVKHNVGQYSQENKDEIEYKKQEILEQAQQCCR